MSLWMNVSSSFFWSGPAVGIIRTEMELARGLNKLAGGKIKFFYRDPSDNLHAISYEEYKNKVETPALKGREVKTEVSRVKGREAIPPQFSQMGRKDSLKAILNGIYSLSPRAMKPLLNFAFFKLKPYGKKVLNFCKKKGALQYIRNIGKSEKKTKGYDKHPFSRGDTIFSCGLDWSYLDYEKVYFLKKELNIKVFSFCYDLIPLLYPQFTCPGIPEMFSRYLLNLSDASDLVFCISEATRKDFERTMPKVGGNLPPTRVIRLGSDIVLNDEAGTSVEKLHGKKFILFVSTIERRKNHEALYKAYHILLEENPEAELPILVFAGMLGWRVENLVEDIALDPLTKKHILTLGRVSDSELNWLYKHALFVCFPSYYEGWGLPIAEALAHGKAVLASDAGSIPEIAPDLIFFENPYNVPGWAAQIKFLVANPQEIENKEKEIRAKYKPQTWDSCVQDVYGILQANGGLK